MPLPAPGHNPPGFANRSSVDMIGNIVVPVLAPNGQLPFLVPNTTTTLIDYPVVTSVPPTVKVHQFGAGDTKREQRFYLGTGARQWKVVRNNLCLADVNTLKTFWEIQQGYIPFYFNVPLEDGTYESVVVQFADEPLIWNYGQNVSKVELSLIEVNTTNQPLNNTINAGAFSTTVGGVPLFRFPSNALATALQSPVQTLIPLVHIIPTIAQGANPTYPDNIWLSDRRCSIGGQLFLPRLLKWEGIGQVACGLPNISAESDDVTLTFGNADRVMRMLADDVMLDMATVEFYIYHVDTGILLSFWAGIITPAGWTSDSGPEFTIKCSDRLSSPFLICPPRVVDRLCDNLFDDDEGDCPFSSKSTSPYIYPSAPTFSGDTTAALPLVFGSGGTPANPTLGTLDPPGPLISDYFNPALIDHSSCDHGYATPNGCLAHGMAPYFNGIYAVPQGIVTKDNTTGFFGLGRSWVTSVSLVNDSAYGQPIPIIVTDELLQVADANGNVTGILPFQANAIIIAGRDEGDYYEAIGVVCEGPVLFAFQTSEGNSSMQDVTDASFSTLDGQQPAVNSAGNFVGFRQAPGTRPAGLGDWLSLDSNGNGVADPTSQNPGWREVYSYNSTYLNTYAAGIAFLVIRRTDQKGIQIVTSASGSQGSQNATDLVSDVLNQHQMVASLFTGWYGWWWSGSGTNDAAYTRNQDTADTASGGTVHMTNPVWLTVNVYLLCQKLFNTLTSKQIQDQTNAVSIQDAVASAAICDLVVDSLVNLQADGTPQQETQYKYYGSIATQRPLRDWLVDILQNCLGYYSFCFGKLKIGIRENAGAALTPSGFPAAFDDGNMIYKSLSLTSLGPKFTKLSGSFADFQYGWVTNTAAYEDDDYAAELGGGGRPLHLVANINFTGTANISQAQRLVATRAREEIGGVTQEERTKARRASWKTTVIALDVDPGAVVSITDPEVPTITTNQGFATFRVERFKLLSDWSIELVGATVTVSMYDLVSGPKPVDVAPTPVPPIFYPGPNQVKWHPNQEIADPSDSLYTVDDHTFALANTQEVMSDGSVQSELIVTGNQPVDIFISDANPPIVRAQSQNATGGALLTGNYWAAVCAKNGQGQFTRFSNIRRFTFGTDGGELILNAIAWPTIPEVTSLTDSGNVGNATLTGASVSGGALVGGYVLTAIDATHWEVFDPSGTSIGIAVENTPFSVSGINFTIVTGSTPTSPSDTITVQASGYVLFAGTDPRTMTAQMEAGGVPPSSITFSGPLKKSIYNMPSPVYKSIRIKAKKEIHSGTLIAQISAIDNTSITLGALANLPGTPDDWTDRTLSPMIRQLDGVVPFFNYLVTAYDASTGKFTLNQDPTVAGLTIDDWMTVRCAANIVIPASGSIPLQVGDTGIVNQVYPQGASDDEQGYILRLMTGTGAGQYRPINASVQVNGTTYVLAGPNFDPMPDATTTFIIEEAAWTYVNDGSQIVVALDNIQASVNIVAAPLEKVALVVMAVLVDTYGLESLETQAHIRDILLVGEEIGTITFAVQLEKYAELAIQNLSINGNQRVGAIQKLAFVFPGVDETDCGWYGTGAIDSSSTSFSPAIEGSSIYPFVEFEKNDFFVFNEPGNYEILKIVDMPPSTPGTWTVARGQFGSIPSSHGGPFYRCSSPVVTVAASQDMFGAEDTISGFSRHHAFSYPNKCTVGASAQAVGSSAQGLPNFKNLYNAALSPPCPGLRTANGAGYVALKLPGDLAVGQFWNTTSIETLGAGANPLGMDSVRCVYAKVGTPPTGSNLVIYVVYMSPDGSSVGLIDAIQIKDSEYYSYAITDPPPGRQMPYHAATDLLNWVPCAFRLYDWPPNIFPYMQNVLSGPNQFNNPFDPTIIVLDPLVEVPFLPGGYAFIIVAQVGATTPGSDLSVAIAT